MAQHAIPPSCTREMPFLMCARSPVDCPLSLWSQMDPLRRQQLAQQVASLIRRIQAPVDRSEGTSHESA